MVKKKRKTKTSQFPNYIHSFVDDMSYLFGVRHYELGLVKAKRDKDKVVAEIEHEEDYQRITITIYPTFWEQSQEEQRKFLLHEFCHTLTDPIFDVAERLRNGRVETHEHQRIANEKSVSRIANILDSLLRGKSRYARESYAKYLDPKKR